MPPRLSAKQLFTWSLVAALVGLVLDYVHLALVDAMQGFIGRGEMIANSLIGFVLGTLSLVLLPLGLAGLVGSFVVRAAGPVEPDAGEQGGRGSGMPPRLSARRLLTWSLIAAAVGLGLQLASSLLIVAVQGLPGWGGTFVSGLVGVAVPVTASVLLPLGLMGVVGSFVVRTLGPAESPEERAEATRTPVGTEAAGAEPPQAGATSAP